MKKVSVIIPCFNHGQYLEEAVQSVLDSTYENVEIIVVNDGSTDEKTLKILDSFSMPKIKIINQLNQGPAVARNNGIIQSIGEYILPLDADDKIHPSFIQKAVMILEEQSNIGIVGPKTELFGADNGEHKVEKYNFPKILLGNCLVCTCLFRKKDWESVGGYNLNMKEGLEDWDFWLSLIELGREVYQFDEITFYYRIHHHSRNTVANHEKYQKLINQIIKNHIDLYLANKPQLVQLLVGKLVSHEKLLKYKKRFILTLSLSIIFAILFFGSLTAFILLK